MESGRCVKLFQLKISLSNDDKRSISGGIEASVRLQKLKFKTVNEERPETVGGNFKPVRAGENLNLSPKGRCKSQLELDGGPLHPKKDNLLRFPN